MPIQASLHQFLAGTSAPRLPAQAAAPLARMPADPHLTVLSFGAGQDSTAMLYLYVHDKAWRARWAPHRFLVVFSDTGDEHPETYAHVEATKAFCAAQGIEFLHLTPDLGFHNPSWQNLIQHYRDKETIGTAAFSGACTDNLKVQPIYKAIEAWLGRNLGAKTGDKLGFYEYAEAFGKLRVLVGIAAKEDHRIPTHRRRGHPAARRPRRIPKSGDAQRAWFNACVQVEYPLYEEGIDRQACQDLITRLGHEVPPPSNCMRCHFLSPIELLWLYRNHPEKFWEWVELEEAKLRRDALGRTARDGSLRVIPAESRNGVFGRKTLREKLEAALAAHGHLSLEELRAYKMSHGHCVRSAY